MLIDENTEFSMAEYNRWTSAVMEKSRTEKDHQTRDRMFVLMVYLSSGSDRLQDTGDLSTKVFLLMTKEAIEGSDYSPESIAGLHSIVGCTNTVGDTNNGDWMAVEAVDVLSNQLPYSDIFEISCYICQSGRLSGKADYPAFKKALETISEMIERDPSVLSLSRSLLASLAVDNDH